MTDDDLEQRALVIPEQKLPLPIAEELSAPAGVTPAYLQNLAERYSFGNEEMKGIVTLRQQYHTNVATVANLLERGYSLPEIEIMLQVREMTSPSLDLSQKGKSLTLTVIGRFMRTFPELQDADADAVEHRVRQAMDYFPRKFPDSSLQTAIELSSRINVIYMDTLYDHIDAVKDAITNQRNGTVKED